MVCAFHGYRRDPLLPQLLGLSRFPSPDPRRRFFLAFPYARLTTVSETVMRQSLECLPRFLLSHTLDEPPPSSVATAPKKAVRLGQSAETWSLSHHPLIAFLSEASPVVGHAPCGPMRGFLSRSSSPFWNTESCRTSLWPSDAAAAGSAPSRTGDLLAPRQQGMDVAACAQPCPAGKGQPRRFVCVRQALREGPHTTGCRLLDCPGYTPSK